MLLVLPCRTSCRISSSEGVPVPFSFVNGEDPGRPLRLTVKDKEERVEIHGGEDTGEIVQARGITWATVGAREHSTFLRRSGERHTSFPLSW